MMVYDFVEKIVYVVGYCGMVGLVFIWCFKCELLGLLVIVDCVECDLCDLDVVRVLFECMCFDVVFVLVVKVGGIFVNNKYLADFFYDNLMIVGNIIYVVYEVEVEKFFFLGFLCIYFKYVN